MQSYISAYWGKAALDGPPGEPGWHPAAYHMLDVAAVAEALVQARPDLARQAERALPGLSLVVPLVAGLHDLGKLSRPFQALRPDLLEELWGQPVPDLARPPPHGDLAVLLWTEIAGIRGILHDTGWSEEVWSVLLMPSFGHHGRPPGCPERAARNLLRNRSPEDVTALVGAMAGLLLPGGPLPGPPSERQARIAGWLVAGIVILADWIGSNRDYFPYRAPDLCLEDYWATVARPRAATAIASVGLAAPAPAAFAGFAALTGITGPPSPLQESCEHLPLGDGPQILVIEDATGSGKTEAALVLAARLMDKGLAGRLFVGLPTQATANAMFGRFGKVYRRLFEPAAHPALGLAHGRSGLQQGFREALQAARQPEGASPPAPEGDEAASPVANAWLADNRKKALLADVGIGTLDQALLGAVKARHQGLRLLGVTGAVLVVDEVHAYDVYTGALLEALLRFQAALGGSAILLSATLAAGQRQRLLAAFADGRGAPLGNTDGQGAAAPYPLITHWCDGDGTPRSIPPRGASPPRPRARLRCERLADEDAAVAVLLEAARQGRCACWIRNTVDDARTAHARLAADLSEDCLTLFHSAFIPAHRADLEARILQSFGKESGPSVRAGRVLVATQVVEQSLDLDFDVMVSDLAPVDLMVQRAGRLHRHDRGERPPPVLRILGPEAVPDPAPDWYVAMFPRAAYVYPDAARLWLSQSLLTGAKGQGEGWDLITEARHLIEGVYGPDAEADVPEALMPTVLATEGEGLAHGALAGVVCLSPHAPFSDALDPWNDDLVVRTRLGDDTVAVVLAEVCGDDLVPLSWADDPAGDRPPAGTFAERRAWAESEVAVSLRRVEAQAPIPSPLAAAHQSLRTRLRWRTEHPILVPLRRSGPATWTGTAVKGGKTVCLTYDSQSGLRADAAPQE